MALTYGERFKLAIDAAFVQRLAGAVADAADGIFAENISTPNYDLRRAMVAYAGPTKSAYLNFAKELGLALLTLNSDFTAETPDADLLSAVQGIWIPYAKLLELRGVISIPEPTP